MDDVDLLGPDQLSEASGIAADLDRVLAFQRQLEMLGAGDIQLMQHRAAGRRDKRAPARGGQSVGDLHRRALGAARHVELGHDLEHDRALPFLRFRLPRFPRFSVSVRFRSV